MTAAGNGWIILFSVSFRHGYYGDDRGLCPDLKVVPTPQCAGLMASLGLIFSDRGTGFAILVPTSRLPALIAHVRGARGEGGCWSWLSFLLQPVNPALVDMTSLPISTNLQAQNLHVSNLSTASVADTLCLSDASGADAALLPVAGASFAVPEAAGAKAVLTDLSGATISCSTTVTGATISFNTADLAYGYYRVAWVDAAGSAMASPARLAFLAVAPSPVSLALLDLLLAQPHRNLGDPAAFPVDPVSGKVAPVVLALPFATRHTIWRYYVVAQGRRNRLATDLAITGGATGFTKSHAELPTGDHAVLFTARKALPLRERSPYSFSLSGHREGADGRRDPIRIDRLPAAPATPVWPVGNPVAGASEIYVYV